MLAADGATTHRFDSPGSGDRDRRVRFGRADPTRSAGIAWRTSPLPTWFVSLSLMRLTVLWSDRGADIRLYLARTREWLAGGDPWSVHFGTFHFAAAPPSLLPMVPFALMPEPLAIALLTVLAVIASFWMLRKLGLPWWWITFPAPRRQPVERQPAALPGPAPARSGGVARADRQGLRDRPLIIQFRIRTLADHRRWWD